MRTSGVSFSHLALFLVFILAGAFAPAWAQSYNPIPAPTNDENSGPETGGGGNIVLTNGQLVLLDFYNFQDTNALSRLIEKKQVSLLLSAFPYSMVDSASDKSRPLSTSPANYIYLSEILINKWGLSSDWNLNAIDGQKPARRQLQKISWSFVDRLETGSAYFTPRFLPQNFRIEQAAYYTAAQKEVKISGVIWSNLNFSNRLGLIIHEKLRQVQLTFGYAMDDQLLQKITVLAIVCKPEPALLHRVLVPRSQLFERYRSLQLYTEQIRQANSVMDQYLNSCLSAEGLSYQP